MMSRKLFLLLFVLVGCRDLSFDYFGKPSGVTPAPSDAGKCTADEQCGPGMFCRKHPENPVGLCAQSDVLLFE
jgi:hypothetical protein